MGDTVADCAWAPTSPAIKDGADLFRQLPHADAAIGDGHLHITSGFHLAAVGILLGQGHIFRLDVQIAPAGHGLPSIDENVNSTWPIWLRSTSTIQRSSAYFL